MKSHYNCIGKAILINTPIMHLRINSHNITEELSKTTLNPLTHTHTHTHTVLQSVCYTPGDGEADHKSSYLYENVPVQTKMAILSKRPKLLAILLYKQFMHLTQINLHPYTQLLSTHQSAYQSFLVTSWFDSIWITVARQVSFKENIYVNINKSSLTTMYESIFSQMYIYLVEKYFCSFGLKEISW